MLTNAKCTSCGAIIEVSADKEAGICKYCNSAYVTQKAINNYIGTQNIASQYNVGGSGNVINIHDNRKKELSEKELELRALGYNRSWKRYIPIVISIFLVVATGILWRANWGRNVIPYMIVFMSTILLSLVFCINYYLTIPRRKRKTLVRMDKMQTK